MKWRVTRHCSHPAPYQIRETVPQHPMVMITDMLIKRLENFPTLDWGSSSVEATKALVPTELVFSDYAPSVFYDEEGGVPYRGQEGAKRRIEVKIKALGPGERFKLLLVGSAGTGKTSLAWIVARRIQEQRIKNGEDPGRFFEVMPAQIEDKAQLDRFVLGLKENDIVFIDEVHVLKDAVGAEPLFHVLADTGEPRYPLGDGKGWHMVPGSVSWIAATTDPGRLDDTAGGALRRRLSPEIFLEAPGADVLAEILNDQDMAIHPDAAYDIAGRSGGLPWQAISIYSEARDFAKVDGSDQILPTHAWEAFQNMGLDENGLFPEDRAVLRALLSAPYKMANGTIRYKMSEAAVCSVTGIDRETYKQRVQPRLLRLSYLTTVGGQCLTEKALEEYGNLIEEE